MTIHLENLGDRSTLVNGHDFVTVQHPLKIRPSGNAYAAAKNLKSASGLWATLPDEICVQILEFLEPASLDTLGQTCKALFAFSRFEELWKAFCVE